MAKCCRETKCLQCCRETNMVLSYRDIKRIEKKENAHRFYSEDGEGWLRLNTAASRCVFHDGCKCTIYRSRPEGCALYPVVYDADARIAILDAECPQRHRFRLTKKKTRQLIHLVSVLRRERNQRLRQLKKSQQTKK